MGWVLDSRRLKFTALHYGVSSIVPFLATLPSSSSSSHYCHSLIHAVDSHELNLSLSLVAPESWCCCSVAVLVGRLYVVDTEYLAALLLGGCEANIRAITFGWRHIHSRKHFWHAKCNSNSGFSISHPIYLTECCCWLRRTVGRLTVEMGGKQRRRKHWWCGGVQISHELHARLLAVNYDGYTTSSERANRRVAT